MTKRLKLVAAGTLIVIFGIFTYISLINNNESTLHQSSPVPLTKTREPKNVYFDLGANIGDSVQSFVGIGSAHGGGGVNTMGAKGKWDIWVFEANPKFNAQLDAVKKQLENYDQNQYTVFLRKQSAITTFDGEITFHLDTSNKYGNHVGSSLLKGHRDIVDSMREGKYEAVTVAACDMAKILKEYYTMEDFIVVKMDIEGAEYELIAHLANQGVLPMIDKMALEFHGFIAPEAGLEPGLKYVLKQAKVELIHWA